MKKNKNKTQASQWYICFLVSELTELFSRNRPQTCTVRPPWAPQGTSGSTMVVFTKADKWVRTVDRWRQ